MSSAEKLDALFPDLNAWAKSELEADDAAGAVLLDDVQRFTKRFIAYPSDHAAVAHTLWLAHCHDMGAWDSTPRIAFLSPEPASGKSRCLEISELLVPNPVEAINCSAAYLFRRISDKSGLPTILFDEIDSVFGPKAKSDNEEIRAVLNAGHRRGAKAGRCVIHGKTVTTEELPCFSAVAVAGLGWLPDSLLTRSLVIRMRRRAPAEIVEPFRRRDYVEAGHRLRDSLSSWIKSASLEKARPVMPPGIEDRNADVWEGLLSIADAAGASWPEKARKAAVALVADSKDGTQSLGIRLLTDLKTIFGDSDQLRTTEVLEKLRALDEAPWSDLKGTPLDARRLAHFLKDYSTGPTTLRIGKDTPKGYRREDLHDAWVRYVPPPKKERETAATPATATVNGVSGDGSVALVSHVAHFSEGAGEDF